MKEELQNLKSHSEVFQDSRPVGREAFSLKVYFPTFRRYEFPTSSESSNPRPLACTVDKTSAKLWPW